MPDAVELVKTIKKAAVDAVEATKPAGVVFGKVTNSEPLEVNVEQKITLTLQQLIVPKRFGEYKLKISYDEPKEVPKPPETDEEKEDPNYNATQIIQVSVNKDITVYDKLEIGDEVILLRMQGGQKFIVLDKIR